MGRARRNVGSVYVTCVLVLTGGGCPWCSAVDSGTGAALSSGRHGVGEVAPERAWVPSIRVSVTRERRAVAHGRSRRGETRAMGTRGWRRGGSGLWRRL